jgi:hypothetical protein
MALYDIMPWQDDSGTTPAISWALINDGATEVFQAGEPVSINSAGELTMSADDPAPMDFAGIAMAPVQYVRGSYSTAGTATTKDPRTGAAYTGLSLCPYVKALPGRRFIARYFATDGNGTDLLAAGIAYATARDLIGESAGMTLVTSTTPDIWVIDTTFGTDKDVWRIEAFLDSTKTSIIFNGSIAKYVVVTPIQSMWLPITDGGGSLAALA